MATQPSAMQWPCGLQVKTLRVGPFAEAPHLVEDGLLQDEELVVVARDLDTHALGSIKQPVREASYLRVVSVLVEAVLHHLGEQGARYSRRGRSVRGGRAEIDVDDSFRPLERGVLLVPALND